MRLMLEETGRDTVSDEKLMPVIGPPLKDGISYIIGSSDAASVDEAIAVYRKHYAAGGMYEGYVYDGIISLLEDLQKQKYFLHVATSKAEHFAEKILVHFDLRRFFVNVYGPDLQGNRSDKTELIEYIIKDQKIEYDSVVMIGDRGFDSIGAKANGVAAAGVLWGFGTREELRNSGADFVLEKPEELMRYIHQ